ncbi:MAG: GntR family transcriptional regulator [Chloroflexota bacterium]
MDAFEPVPAPRQALWESIVANLRRAIILGELPPELHLEEPTLAEKFGVSRIPIREALSRLAHEGLVRIEPRRGAFVVGVTEADIHDIYEVRRLIETYAIRQAAARAVAADLPRLRAFADQMAEAVERGEVQLVAVPDVNFHRQIVILSGNQRLLAAWEPIGGLVAAMLSITDTTYRDMPRAAASHGRLIEQIQARDADAAEREIVEHLEHGESVMRQAMHEVVLAGARDGDRSIRS